MDGLGLRGSLLVPVKPSTLCSTSVVNFPEEVVVHQCF